MRNQKGFFVVLLIFLVELSKGQNNNRRTEVNVGVVTDVGTISDVALHCINMSVADFYSSRPQFQTRLVVNVGDSRNDVVGAAAAGAFLPLLSPLSSLSVSLVSIYIFGLDMLPFFFT